ncbi:MAG: hypothetical protein KAV99_02495 [Candidatus Latescibacteria bacterium]|nr:hypothetical protein [Candidatus Latescibacterota bacterium]
MVKRFSVLMVLSLLLIGSTAWAGENADATITFDLEKEVTAGDGENTSIMDVGPDEVVVLSIYGHGLSNLKGYTIDLKFEPDLVSNTGGGFMSFSPLELDVFNSAGLTPSTVGPAVSEDVVGLGSSVLKDPYTADEAPDGDGLLAWLKFTTSAEFTTATIATFSLDKGVLIGVDGANDEVADKPSAWLNTTAVEPTSWGQIKALFK